MSETPAPAAPAAPGGPGDGPRRGAPLAADRDPESLCTATLSDGSGRPCTRFKTKGSTVCQVHGAHKAPVARHTIAKLAEKQGIELPEVRPKDFPRVAAEVISWNLAQFAALGTELESLRLLHSPVDHARQYMDIFSLLDQMGKTIATLTKAAAALPAIPDDPPVSPAREQVMEALAGIQKRLFPAGAHCSTCTCGSQSDGTVAEPLEGRVVDASEGPQGPGGTVLPYPGAEPSGGGSGDGLL